MVKSLKKLKQGFKKRSNQIKTLIKRRYINEATGSVIYIKVARDTSIILLASGSFAYCFPFVMNGCLSIKSNAAQKLAMLRGSSETLPSIELEVENVNKVSNLLTKKSFLTGVLVITLVGSTVFFHGPIEDLYDKLLDSLKNVNVDVDIDTESLPSYSIGKKPFSAYDTKDISNATATGIFYSSLLFRKLLIRWILYGVAGPAYPMAGTVANIAFDICFGSNPVFGPTMPVPMIGTDDSTAFMVFQGYLNRSIQCVWQGSQYLILAGE